MYPRWFIILANVIILGVLIALGVWLKFMGWQFCLGGVFGFFLAFAWIRMETGRWP